MGAVDNRLSDMLRLFSNPVRGSDNDLAVSRGRFPAWAISLCIHLLLLLVLGVFVRSRPRGLPGATERSGSIVIAHANAQREVEYFDESDSQQGAQGESEPADAALQEWTGAALSEPNVELPRIDLPGAVDPAVASQMTESRRLTISGRPVISPSRITAEQLAAERTRLKARGPTGPPGEVALFGSATAVGHSFVFVIDRSKSMGGDGLNALAAAERELAAALAQLKPHHKFQIIAYHHKRVYLVGRRLVRATPENRRLVGQFFGGLASFGGTDHRAALNAALNLEPDVIFLLTDGGAPELNAVDLRSLHKRTGNRVSVHCIQFGFGPLQDDNAFMRRLAVQNRGAFGYVNMSP